jgi:heat shock 70kDa protein 1/2/6/8
MMTSWAIDRVRCVALLVRLGARRVRSARREMSARDAAALADAADAALDAALAALTLPSSRLAAPVGEAATSASSPTSSMPSTPVLPGRGSLSGPVIGIDLGTTFSCVAVYEDGDVAVITNAHGHRTTPSVVAYALAPDTASAPSASSTSASASRRHGSVGGSAAVNSPVTGSGSQPPLVRTVGEVARQQAVRRPTWTLFDAKRLIGRPAADPAVAAMQPLWPFRVVPGDRGRSVFEMSEGGRSVRISPEEVSAAVLFELRQCAESYLGVPVHDAVITVPAYFNDAQRQATRDAGEIAGLRVLRIINEPTAASLAYGLDRLSYEAGAKTLLVYDLGGGTLDVTVMTVDAGVFECLSSRGDMQLGGQDFDNALLLHCVDLFAQQTGHDVRQQPKALNKLRHQCQEAKHTLSTSTTVSRKSVGDTGVVFS